MLKLPSRKLRRAKHWRKSPRWLSVAT